MSISQEAQHGMASVFAVLILVNFVGNSLVIRIIHTNRYMKTPMNYLLMNLAVADMTVAGFLVPRYVLRNAFTHPWGVAGTYMCKFLTGEVFTWVGALSSVYTLVAISIERYYAVMKPHSSKSRFTTKKSKLTAAACWVFATLWNLPLFLFSYFDEKNKFCNFAWPFKDFTKYHSTLVALVYGAIPIPTMLYLYCRVSHKLWFHHKQIGISPNQVHTKARKRVTKTVLIVSIIFCITWTPNLVIYPISSFTSVALYDSVHILSIICVAINSSVNPLIYSLHSNMFRKHLRQALCCFDRKQVGVTDAVAAQPRQLSVIVSPNHM